MRLAACTIIAKNYLPHARALMSSLEKWHPEWARYVILVDTLDGHFDPSAENFEIVFSKDLDLPRTAWFHFKYTILELSTAVKPYALRKLLREQDLDALVYLDPDIQLYCRLAPVVRALQDSDIIITPHLTGPIMDDKRPGELDILRSGVYNLGFIALTRRSAAMSFLDWWCERLKDHCVVAPEAGLFVDQRWCDLLPGLFENVGILREPGLNVAYWNLHSRQVERCGGQLVVNGEPLYFFHFSGFDPERPDQLSRYQDRFQFANIPVIRDLASTYRESLLRNGHQECTHWPYRFGLIADKAPIPDILRSILGENARLADEVGDPFSVSGFNDICKAWNEPLGDPAGPPFFTRLALRIYALRADLRAAYPDIYGRDREGFFRWLAHIGPREYGTPDEVNAPFRLALQQGFERNQPPAFEQPSQGGVSQIDNDLRTRLRMHALNQFIHRSRPDLRRAFPDPTGRDRLAYLTWMSTYGRLEYQMDSESAAVLQSEWELTVAAEFSSLQAFWQRIRRTAYAVWARMTVRTTGNVTPRP